MLRNLTHFYILVSASDNDTEMIDLSQLPIASRKGISWEEITKRRSGAVDCAASDIEIFLFWLFTFR